MPLVVAGVLLVFQRRFLVGGLLTMFAAALELNANHPQMTYYLLFLILIITAFYCYKQLKDKEYKSLFTAFGIFVIAGILAIGANATSLLATAEYAKYSTRGKSELTFSPDGSKSTSDNAMTHDYITEYSYGIAESFNLISPRIFGGSNGENIGANTNMYEFLIGKSVPEDQAKEFVSSMPAYWGDQPIVAAPAYIGAVVFFLCLVALFLDKRKIKYVFVAGTVVSLILSWGKNFPILTDFFIDTIPMYNKFRAVSSIQVILELCIPVLAIMGLQSFFKEEKAQQLKGLYLSGGVFFGIIAFLIAIKSQFSFSGGSDAYYLENYGSEFVNALKEDRKSLYSADLLRSGFLVLLAFGVLWFFVKNKISNSTAVILVGIIMISDLFFIDKNYVNAKSFVSPSEVDVPFQPTASDLEILRDTSHYRVFEVDGNMSSARASYFHQSIGGYSAVKPRRMQQLFDYQIAKNNMEVLNMLNAKFIIQTDKEGKEFPTYNPNHNGNAWFVQKVKFVNSPDQEMKALDSIDSKKVVVVNQPEFGPFFKGEITSFNVDSTATIQLLSYEPNHLKYVSNNSNPGVAVFSEMYYADGWNATIDGKSASHFRADYALRAMKIPAGKHSIEFKFEPQVVKTGSTIALISFILMILLMGAAIYLEQKKAKQ
jgi:hypothetical protein